MAIVDPTLLLRGRKLFPELTDKEYEIGILYCSGFTRDQLVTLYDLSLRQVDSLFRKVRRKLCVQTNEMLIPTVIVRVLLSSILAA